MKKLVTKLGKYEKKNCKKKLNKIYANERQPLQRMSKFNIRIRTCGYEELDILIFLNVYFKPITKVYFKPTIKVYFKPKIKVYFEPKIKVYFKPKMEVYFKTNSS